MPCNSVAVIKAQIEADHVTELLASQPALRALAQELVTRGVLQAEPQLTISSGQAVLIIPGGTQVVIDNRGLRVVARYLGYQQQQQLTDKIAEIAKALAIPLVQQQLVNAVESRYGTYAVTSDQQVGSARVVKLRIPL